MQKVILNEKRPLVLMSAAQVQAGCGATACLLGAHSTVSFGLVWFGFDRVLHNKGFYTLAEIIITRLMLFVFLHEGCPWHGEEVNT